jgi:hypothetical protein
MDIVKFLTLKTFRIYVCLCFIVSNNKYLELFGEMCLLVDYDAFSVEPRTLQLYRGSLVFDENLSWP